MPQTADMAKNLVFRKPSGLTPRVYPIPMEERPVYFDVGLYERQSGDADPFTTDDAARLEALGYTLVWPVPHEPTRP